METERMDQKLLVAEENCNATADLSYISNKTSRYKTDGTEMSLPCETTTPTDDGTEAIDITETDVSGPETSPGKSLAGEDKQVKPYTYILQDSSPESSELTQPCKDTEDKQTDIGEISKENVNKKDHAHAEDQQNETSHAGKNIEHNNHQAEEDEIESPKEPNDTVDQRGDLSILEDTGKTTNAENEPAQVQDNNNNIVDNTDNNDKKVRHTSTPDCIVQRISPEVFQLAQFSPTNLYGKEEGGDCLRWVCKSLPAHTQTSSTLNTPEPILFEDTDSNDSLWPTAYRLCQELTENPLPENNGNSFVEMQPADLSSAVLSPRGVKRAFDQMFDDSSFSSAPNKCMPAAAITSYINQGRPPDISTWTAVSASTQPQEVDMYTEQAGPWNKPTCAVPPRPQELPYNMQSSYNVDWNANTYPVQSENNRKKLYTGQVYSRCQNMDLNSNCQHYSNYCDNFNYNNNSQMYNNGQMYGSPYSKANDNFYAYQNRTYASAQRSHFSHGTNYRGPWSRPVGPSAASYRLDFSSPVQFPDQEPLLNFVSCQSYLPENVTRPRPVLATHSQTTGVFGQYNLAPQQNHTETTNTHVINGAHSGETSMWTSPNPQLHEMQYTAVRVDENENVENSSYNLETNTNSLPGIQTNHVELECNETLMPEEDSSDKTSDVTRIANTEEAAETATDEIVDNCPGKDMGDENGNKCNDFCGELVVNNNAEACDSLVSKSVEEDPNLSTHSLVIDLTNDMDISGGKKTVNRSPTKQTHNESVPSIKKKKLYTEVYLRKGQPVAPRCINSALDLRKKVLKQSQGHRQANVQSIFKKPEDRELLGEPVVPISAVLNTLSGQTLACNGASLVPYMNSIFAAMAKFKKSQVPEQNSGVNTSQSNTASIRGRPIAPQPNSVGFPKTRRAPLAQNIRKQTEQLPNPRINITNLPLPLYTTPLRCPIRPLVPVVNYGVSGNRWLNPFLYRLNIGYPASFVSTPATNAVPPTASKTPCMSVGPETNTAGNVCQHSNQSTPVTSIPPNSLVTATTVNVNSNSSVIQPTANCSSSQLGNIGAADVETNCRNTADNSFTTVDKNNNASVTVDSMSDNFGKVQSSANIQGDSASQISDSSRMNVVNEVSMAINGNSYKTAAVQTSSLLMFEPIPDLMKSKQTPQPNAAFKARHYTFSQLTIGSFKYTCGMSYSDRTARVKFLFKNRHMVYEFQLDRPEQQPNTLKQMAEITVPFDSIVALWLFDRDMRVQVNKVPKVWVGSRGIERNASNRLSSATVYNRRTVVDVTDNQVAKSPFHHIQFRTMCVIKIRRELCRFDDRFTELFRQPLILDPSRSLEPGPPHIHSKLLDPSIQLPTDKNNNWGPMYQPDVQPSYLPGIPQPLTSCGCTDGCSDASCACCVKGVTCTEGLCGCVGCRNPLNVLHQLGLPADQARTDACLMENIYQITRLDCYVKMQVMLDCCQIPLVLLNCIPGQKKCPNTNCQARYKYSWCTAQLYNEDVTPRNHCLQCGRCTDYRNTHCKACNVCYFSGESKSFKCPICHNGESPYQDPESSTDSDSPN